MTDASLVEATEPEEAFAILADGTRIEILEALFDADDQRATFSELRSAVGVRDSGQFNYHLGKLVDRFVAKTEDGYQLTTAGQLVVGALLAGGYTMTGTVDSFQLTDPCPVCGSSLSFAYEHERVSIACDDCVFSNAFAVPPGAFVGYDLETLPYVAERYARSYYFKLQAGFCPLCDGSLAWSIIPLSDIAGLDAPSRFDDFPIVAYDCQRCGGDHQLGLNTLLLHHPAVVSFLYEHGIDVRTVPIWQIDAWSTDMEHNRITATDPLRATLCFEAGGEQLILTVDDSVTVLEIVRRDGG